MMNRGIEELSKERSYAHTRSEKITKKLDQITVNNLSEHTALYALMREYDSVSEDIEKCKNAETKALLSRRLEEIKERLKRDFFVCDTAK